VDDEEEAAAAAVAAATVCAAGLSCTVIVPMMALLHMIYTAPGQNPARSLRRPLLAMSAQKCMLCIRAARSISRGYVSRLLTSPPTAPDVACRKGVSGGSMSSQNLNVTCTGPKMKRASTHTIHTLCA
jgi:hypothetical protein